MIYNFSKNLENLNINDLLLLAHLSRNSSTIEDGSIKEKLLQKFSIDEIRLNQEVILKHLLQPENQKLLSDKKNDYFMKLRNISDINDPLFQEIENFQTLLAIGLWKYHLHLNEELEQFVRDFDRIDDEREREWIINNIKNLG